MDPLIQLITAIRGLGNTVNCEAVLIPVVPPEKRWMWAILHSTEMVFVQTEL